MARSKSSDTWLREHHNDEYVRQSKIDGYRSRAVYKLKEMDEKDHLIQKGMTIIDLGAAPGGWSQYAARKIAENGKIVALDILEMDPLAGVEVVCGDFREESVLNELLSCMNQQKADLVMSDMAPNMSGVRATDQASSMYLTELAIDLVDTVLEPGGSFVAKVFQGEGFDEYIRSCRQRFKRVFTRKPQASRARSREVYVLGRGYSV